MKRQPTARTRSLFFGLIAAVSCTLSGVNALAQPAPRPRVVVVPVVVAGDSATPERLAENVANVGRALSEEADLVDAAEVRTRQPTAVRPRRETPPWEDDEAFEADETVFDDGTVRP